MTIGATVAGNDGDIQPSGREGEKKTRGRGMEGRVCTPCRIPQANRCQLTCHQTVDKESAEKDSKRRSPCGRVTIESTGRTTRLHLPGKRLKSRHPLSPAVLLGAKDTSHSQRYLCRMRLTQPVHCLHSVRLCSLSPLTHRLQAHAQRPIMPGLRHHL